MKHQYDSLKTTLFIKQRTFDYTMLVAWDSIQAKTCDQWLEKGLSLTEVAERYGYKKAGVLESGRFVRTREKLGSVFQSKLLNMADGEVSNWMKVNKRLIKLQRHAVTTEYTPLEDVEEKIRKDIQFRWSRSALKDSLKAFRSEADIIIFKERVLGDPDEE